MNSIVISLKDKIILSESNVSKIRAYISRKYPDLSYGKRAGIFADVVNRILDGNIPNLPEEQRRLVKRCLFTHITHRPSFVVDCLDVFYAAVQSKVLGNIFFKELTLWLSNVLGEQVTKESVFDFVVCARRLMAEMQTENIIGIFTVVEQQTGGIKFLNSSEEIYEEAAASVVEFDSSNLWNETKDVEKLKETIIEPGEEIACATKFDDEEINDEDGVLCLTKEKVSSGICEDIEDTIKVNTFHVGVIYNTTIKFFSSVEKNLYINVFEHGWKYVQHLLPELCTFHWQKWRTSLTLRNSFIKKVCTASITVGIFATIIPPIQFNHTMGHTMIAGTNAVIIDYSLEEMEESKIYSYEPEQDLVLDTPILLEDSKQETEIWEEGAPKIEDAKSAEIVEQNVQERLEEIIEESIKENIKEEIEESANENTDESDDVNAEEITEDHDEDLSNLPKIRMRATAYDLSIESCGKDRSHPQYGITYTGTRATVGRTIAVDPRVIPLGSKVKITFPEKYSHMDGIYIAEDTGSLIKGNRIDIFWGEDEVGSSEVNKSAKRFGVQYVEVQILE